MSSQPPITDAINAVAGHVNLLTWATGILTVVGGGIFRMFWRHQTKLTVHDGQISSMQKQCADHHDAINRREADTNRNIGQIFDLLRTHGETLSGNTKTLEMILRELKPNK